MLFGDFGEEPPQRALPTARAIAAFTVGYPCRDDVLASGASATSFAVGVISTLAPGAIGDAQANDVAAGE